MWNDDYISFLVKEVWKIDKPLNVLDCGCGFGYMRMMLMPLLPEGSTYTGIYFNAHLLQEAENYCRMQRKIQTYMVDNKENLKYLHYRG